MMIRQLKKFTLSQSWNDSPTHRDVDDQRQTDSAKMVLAGALPGSLSSPFDGLPINRAHDEFRLWRFCPTGSSNSMKIELKVFPRNAESGEGCPVYNALSYEWGPSTETRAISVNDGCLEITDSLWKFLEVLVSEAIKTEWFWADQICIDQTNVHERGHQVNQMSNIYWGAGYVFVNLGPKSANPSCDAILYKENGPSSNMHDDHKVTDAMVLTAIDLFTRSYWTRLWIVQELYLAQRTLFWCGSSRISVYWLRSYWRWILRQRETRVALICSHTAGFEKAVDFLADFEHLIGTALEESGYRKKELKDRYMNLYSTLVCGRHNSCKDPRDKIFGMQALVTVRERISVDYSRSMEDIMLSAARVIVRAKLERWNVRNWSTAQYADVTLEHVIEVLENVAGYDMSHIVKGLFWSYLVATLTKCSSVVIDETTEAKNVETLARIAQLAVTERQQALSAELCDLRPVNPKHVIPVVSRHGFLMYAGFVAHPEEWRFPTESPSSQWPQSKVDATMENYRLQLHSLRQATNAAGLM